MRNYRTGAHTKYDLKVHLVWIPKYRKKVFTKEVSVRLRDIIRQVAMEYEIQIISGKVASDHVHLFISYRPMQYFKGTSSRILLQEFSHLKKIFWGKHLWARGYLAVSSGTITDELIMDYIQNQEGEDLDDSRFQIGS